MINPQIFLFLKRSYVRHFLEWSQSDQCVCKEGTSKPNGTVWKIISNIVTLNKHEKSDQIVCKEVQQIKAQATHCKTLFIAMYCSGSSREMWTSAIIQGDVEIQWMGICNICNSWVPAQGEGDQTCLFIKIKVGYHSFIEHFFPGTF